MDKQETHAVNENPTEMANHDQDEKENSVQSNNVGSQIIQQPPVQAILNDNTLSAPQPAPDYSILSPHMKIFMVLITVFASFFSPFSSFLYIPAITPIAVEYARSIADINFSVTVYQIMQAVAPMFFGDLSDQLGRRPVYFMTFSIYLAANIGLALQHNYAALLVLRALQSTGSSATVAIGSAVMADFTTSADRGGFITAVQASTMFAPALAPVIGGILSQFLGWRSTFWFLVIAAGVFLFIYVPWVPETARNVVGNGSIPPPRLNASFTRPWKGHSDLEAHNQTSIISPRKRKIPIPNIWAAILIVFEKDVGLLMLFMSLFIMANYAMLVPLQNVLRVRFGLNDLQVGLCYIPFSVGSVFSAVICGRLLNWQYARVAKSIGVAPDRKRGDDLRKFPIERARLDIAWPWVFLACSMIIAWGWVVDAASGLAAPLVVLFFAGAGLSGPVSILTTLLIDLYPMNPGRVSSSFNLTRATMSAIGTAVVQYIIDAWGHGFTYLFLGLLVLSFSPCVLIVRRWGPEWREERYLRLEQELRVVV